MIQLQVHDWRTSGAVGEEEGRRCDSGGAHSNLKFLNVHFNVLLFNLMLYAWVSDMTKISNEDNLAISY